MIVEPKTVRIFGILQVFIALCMHVLAIIQIVLVPSWGSIFAGGIWCGSFVVFTGCIGYLVARKRTNGNPHRRTIGTMIGLAVCSTILSGIIIVIYLIQLFEFSERLRCPKDEYPTPSSSYSSWDSLCSRYHQNRDWHVTIREAEIGVVSSCFLVVAAGIEFFLALVTSMYGCNVCYSGLYSQTRHRRVTYERQSVDGYVNVTIPYSGNYSPRLSVQTPGTQPQQFVPTAFSAQTAGTQPQDIFTGFRALTPSAPPIYSTQTACTQSQVPTTFSDQPTGTQPLGVPTAFSDQTTDTQPLDVRTTFSDRTTGTQPLDVPTTFSNQTTGTKPLDVPTTFSDQTADTQPLDVPTTFSDQTADTQPLDVPTTFSNQTTGTKPLDVPTTFSDQTADTQSLDVPTTFSDQTAGTQPLDVPTAFSDQTTGNHPEPSVPAMECEETQQTLQSESDDMPPVVDSKL